MVNAPGHGFTSSSFLHSVQKEHPLDKMALGFLGKKSGDARSDSSNSNDHTKNEKTDIELGRGGTLDDDSSDSMTVGKQMEMEAGNAIKYRTCSWPKVRRLPKNSRHAQILIKLRQQHCYSPSTSVWPSCRSHGHTLFLVWSPVSS